MRLNIFWSLICKIKGLSDGLPLAKYIFFAATSFKPSPPNPYTVSVGKATKPPSFIHCPALFKVSYKKGEKYELAWERWACTTSTGNCCLSDAKGMLKNANELKTEMNDMLGAVKAQDAEAANTAVLKLDNTTYKISKTLSSPLWKMASHIPVAGKYVKSVDTLIGLVEDASDDIIKPAVATISEYPMSGQ